MKKEKFNEKEDIIIDEKKEKHKSKTNNKTIYRDEGIKNIKKIIKRI